MATNPSDPSEPQTILNTTMTANEARTLRRVFRGSVASIAKIEDQCRELREDVEVALDRLNEVIERAEQG